MKFGIFAAFDPETLIFGEMPVEDIQLDSRHAIKVALDDLDWLPVPGHVDQQSAPWEAWPVLNTDEW